MTTLNDRIDDMFSEAQAEVHALANRHHRSIGQLFRRAQERIDWRFRLPNATETMRNEVRRGHLAVHRWMLGA